MLNLFKHLSLVGILLGAIFSAATVFAAPPAIAPVPTASGTPPSEIEVGLSAVEKKDYAKAFSVFSRLAEAGNAEAQHNLAMLYRTGSGVKKDLTASLKWFRQAAEQGIPDAQYYLGYMYENGEGVEKNAHSALIWYRKAAEQGQGLAQINLGVLYANGVSVPQDVRQAYLWFHAATAQGYKAAFENKMIIEAALKEQGEEGLAILESLKKQEHEYFQKYVEPFAKRPTDHLKGKKPNFKH